jgi:hypothetical protein
MSESTALVPVPFYPPVRSGAGALFKFGERPGRPLFREQAVRTIASRPDEGMAYRRDGLLVDDACIGTRVNVYA